MINLPMLGTPSCSDAGAVGRGQELPTAAASEHPPFTAGSIVPEGLEPAA